MSETEEVLAALERNGVYFTDSGTRTKTKNGKPKMAMKIDSPASFEKKIRGAFMELYKGLGLLRTYRFFFLLLYSFF